MKESKGLCFFGLLLTALMFFSFLFMIYGSELSFVISYVFLIVLLLFSYFSISKFLRLFQVFYLFYLGIGLLNISTWRGTIDSYTVSLYLFSVVLFLVPLHLVHVTTVNNGLLPVFTIKGKVYLPVFYVHLAVVYLCLAYIYNTIGPVMFNQDLRFDIPTEFSYIIKSTIGAVAFLPIIGRSRTKIFVLLFLATIPSILIGARGVALLGIFSFFAMAFFYKESVVKVNKKYVLFFAIVGLLIIYVGFFIRRDGTGHLISVKELIDLYFYSDNFLVYAVAPLYLAFRETLGLTFHIISHDVGNTINQYPLFIADLFTVLPGENLAAGQTLGMILGRTGGGGLTPGMLGGVFIDFGTLAVLIFFVFGCFISVIFRLALTKVNFFPIYIVLTTQFFHLFHRGFFKPEYITTVVICFFYYLTISKRKF